MSYEKAEEIATKELDGIGFDELLRRFVEDGSEDDVEDFKAELGREIVDELFDELRDVLKCEHGESRKEKAAAFGISAATILLTVGNSNMDKMIDAVVTYRAGQLSEPEGV